MTNCNVATDGHHNRQPGAVHTQSNTIQHFDAGKTYHNGDNVIYKLTVISYCHCVVHWKLLMVSSLVYRFSTYPLLKTFAWSLPIHGSYLQTTCWIYECSDLHGLYVSIIIAGMTCHLINKAEAELHLNVESTRSTAGKESCLREFRVKLQQSVDQDH